ncbi:MAG: hypothetical protein R3C05_02735 [Pirellulaceae bacterium]
MLGLISRQALVLIDAAERIVWAANLEILALLVAGRSYRFVCLSQCCLPVDARRGRLNRQGSDDAAAIKQEASKLIQELASPGFGERKNAANQLWKLGPGISDQLRQVIAEGDAESKAGGTDPS